MRTNCILRLLRGHFQLALLAAILPVLFAAAPPPALAQGDRNASAGDFDYYVLALSWSPTYCAGQSSGDNGASSHADRHGYGRRDSGDQCSGTRPYAFVLHGLWPQYERKGWPEFCQTAGRAWVPGETIDRMLDVMPSRHLVIQEYKKHGVCSGLEPQAYFDAARKAYGSIRVPEQFQGPKEPQKLSPEDVQRAFLEANKQLSAPSIQVVCSRDSLSEIRICLTKDLSPRACSRNEQERHCGYSTVTVPPVQSSGTGSNGGPS
jgi:ribonuclease T2